MKEAQIVTLEIRTYYGHLVFETSGDSIKECVFQALASGICLSDSNCDPAPVRPVDRDTFMVDFQDMQTLKDLILIECSESILDKILNGALSGKISWDDYRRVSYLIQATKELYSTAPSPRKLPE